MVRGGCVIGGGPDAETVASALAVELGFARVALDSAVEEAIEAGGVLSNSLKTAQDVSGIIPDNLLADALGVALGGLGSSSGFIVVGWPCNSSQADCLLRMLESKELDLAFVIDVSGGKRDTGASGVLQAVTSVIPLHVEAGDSDDMLINAANEAAISALQQFDSGATKAASDVYWIDPRVTSNISIGSSLLKSPALPKAQEYGSSLQWKKDLKRHDRLKYDPRDKFEAPVASNMDYGWTVKDPELYKKDPVLYHPRVQSKETKYANALLLGPRHI